MLIKKEAASVVTYLQPLASLLREKQLEPEKIFLKHGIEISDTLNSEVYVDINKVRSLLTYSEQVLDDPSLGINMAKRTEYSVFGAVGMAIAAGGSLLGVLQRAKRYHQLLGTTIQFEIDIIDDRVKVSFFQLTEQQPHSQGIQYLMAVIVRMIRTRLFSKVDPLEIYVIRDDRDYLDKMSCYFHVVPKVGEHYAMFLDKNLMSKELNASEPAIAAAMESVLNSRLKAQGKADFITQLILWIENHLPGGEPSIAQAAKEFHLSVRSLQRRLKEDDISWQQLIMSVRKTRVEHYMKMPDVTVTQLAFLLGFTNVSAFSRAFKKWYGVSPTHYKQNITKTNVS